MSEDTGYKQRLIELKVWLPEIIDAVKKDIKNEHLKKDYTFSKKYFPGKSINKIGIDEIAEGYTKALQDEEAAEALGEFIVQRWIFNHSEMYHFFEERLSKINPDFTEIKELTPDQASSHQDAAFKEFGALKTYIFSALNGVAFSKEQLKKMEQSATQEKKSAKETQIKEAEKRSYEELKSQHEMEMARLTDKYEKKLLGFQKKYTQDVEMLKKQLGNLQRKLTKV